jgi:hypothetical protein
MEPDPWELRRPDLLLAAVAAHHPFDVPRALLAVVEGPYDDQRLTGSTVLWDRPPAEERARTTRTEKALEALGLGWTRLPYDEPPLVVPVVVRPGPCWFSWDESEVVLGLRYGSNLVDVRQGALLTVTGQGWYAPLDELWGTHPRAVWSTARGCVSGSMSAQARREVAHDRDAA